MLPCASVLPTIRVALALVSVPVAAARANPASAVPSTAGDLVQLQVTYRYELDDAELRRERVGEPGQDPLAPLPARRELTFRQVRQLVTPRAELAVRRDVWLSFAAPIVIAQSRELRLADGVDAATASTFTDGILPPGGFDAQAPGAAPPGGRVFRGVERSGIPELRGGIGYAAMSQARDDTKPTWKLGVEGRFAIGRTMRFGAVAAAGQAREAGVSTGVHELRLWTSIGRRFRYFEGWFEASWQLPIYRRSTSLFQDPGFGAATIGPGQTAGAAFGVETYVIDNPTSGTRFSVDLGARATAHLEGRGYSELWEVFALAGDPARDGPLVLDRDPSEPGQQALRHPGISNIESYLETAGSVALRARLGRHIQLAAHGEVVWKTDHVISFADAGVDLPQCPSGAPRCEPDGNDVVNPGTSEVNPLHARRIDLVGHRYHAGDHRGIVLGVEAQILF